MQPSNISKSAPSHLLADGRGVAHQLLVTVADVMLPARVLIQPSFYLHEALDVMLRLRVSSLVVEPLLPIGPWGIVTQRDLEVRLASNGRGLMCVRDVLSVPPFVVAPGMRIDDCSTLMLASGVRQVIVVEARRPVGIIGDSDIFQAIEGRR